MTTDLLAAANFAISLAALGPLVVKRGRVGRPVAIIVVASFLLLSILMILRAYEHKARIDLLEESIVESLADGYDRPFDEIHAELLFPSFRDSVEALFSAVEDGKVGQRWINVRAADGSLLRLRVYYSKDKSGRLPRTSFLLFPDEPARHEGRQTHPSFGGLKAI